MSDVDPRVEPVARALCAESPDQYDSRDLASSPDRDLYVRAAVAALAAADAVGEDRLTGETLICCDHAMVATPQCEHGGDALVPLGDLIDSYSSPSTADAVEAQDRPCQVSAECVRRAGHEGYCRTAQDRPADWVSVRIVTPQPGGGAVEASREDRPRCQHCATPTLADERSFMCEAHAIEADAALHTAEAERDQLREALDEALLLLAAKGASPLDLERLCRPLSGEDPA